MKKPLLMRSGLSGEGNVKGHLSLLIFISVSCGCNPSPPTREAHESGCSPDPLAELALEIETITETRSAGPVISIAATTADSVFLIGGTGRLLFLRTIGGLREIKHPWEEPLSVLAKGMDGVLLAAGHRLFRVEKGGEEVTELRLSFSPESRIWGVVEDSTSIWIVVKKGTSFHLTVSRPDPVTKEYLTVTSMALKGPSSLAAVRENKVLLSRQTEPFSLEVWELIWDKLTLESRFIEPSQPRHNADLGFPGFSISAFPIGCNRALQVIGDVKSTTRWLTLFDMETGAVVRERHLSTPLGFVQALVDERVLIGAIEKPGGSDVLLARWTWEGSESNTLKGDGG